MSFSSSSDTRLKILLVTDGKPGHLNQLKGLLFQLQRLSQTESRWIEVNHPHCSWLSCFAKQKAGFNPDIVIGAGHKTQKYVLILGRNAQTCILMKPSLPLFLFDYAIIPAHDNVTEKNNILTTDGVLNQVQPQTDRSPGTRTGLILIGGQSRHYEWSNTNIVMQVVSLVSASQRHWHLTNSRRTPADFLPELKQKLARQGLTDRVSIFPQDTTELDWLANQYQSAAEIWVTPDSVSMVYEAITSGSATGLFDMTPIKPGRIVRGISRLIEYQRVTPFAYWKLSGKMHKNKDDKPFCEAERAAHWLLDRLKSKAQKPFRPAP